MEGSEGNADSSALKPMDPSQKIALVPFVQGEPSVHLLDQDGKASAARDRSPEDDFQMAVRSLGTGPTDEGVSERAGVEGDNQPRDASGHTGDEKREGEPEGDEGDGSGATKEAASPPEHPLQKAITSFDMALGELNQLVHLVDLARAGEFMVLKRVTPTEEDQATAMPEQSARPGDGVPREALPTMVTLKRSQLKGAAEQLRKRAKRLRETTHVQKVFQRGVMHLRKSWRIVAPNHGKVNVPLQVGEALCVDCSFGSAGGRPVPNTAAAGSRHRHPWLFQLTCGDDGQLKAQPSSMQHLKAFEVQLISVATGACEHSLRASFPASSNARDSAVAGEEIKAEPSVSNGGGMPEVGRLGDLGDIQIQMGDLEQHISRQQHSVFWEEVFETLKAEALVDGKDGWLVHQDERCDGVGANCGMAPDVQRAQVVARRDAGSNKGVGPEVGARIPADAAGGKVGNGTAGGHLSAASTWKAVRRVLLHHLFRSEVVQGLANVRNRRFLAVALQRRSMEGAARFEFSLTRPDFRSLAAAGQPRGVQTGKAAQRVNRLPS
eukprot:g11947.t1